MKLLFVTTTAIASLAMVGSASAADLCAPRPHHHRHHAHCCVAPKVVQETPVVHTTRVIEKTVVEHEIIELPAKVIAPRPPCCASAPQVSQKPVCPPPQPCPESQTDTLRPEGEGWFPGINPHNGRCTWVHHGQAAINFPNPGSQRGSAYPNQQPAYYERAPTYGYNGYVTDQEPASYDPNYGAAETGDPVIIEEQPAETGQ